MNNLSNKLVEKDLFPFPLKAAFYILILIFIIYSLLPSVGSHVSRRREECLSHLKDITMALFKYENKYGHFPPAYTTDKNGKPVHSWRVLILPFMGFENLFKRYDFSEPWNGPNNSLLAEEMPSIYHCPSSDASNPWATNYAAVVGSNTAWPGDKSVGLHDISDEPSRTILLVEVADSNINWMEPRDLNFEDAKSGINIDKKRGISSNHACGVFVSFADGHQ
jgi:hypothetical protein